jgi:hypothetical protein
LEAFLSAEANGVLTLKPTKDRIHVRPFLEGTWSGSCSDPQGKPLRAEFIMSPDLSNPRQTQIQGDLEFIPSSHGKFKMVVDDQNHNYETMGLGSCTANYFKQTFSCILSAPPSKAFGLGQSGLKVMLSGGFAYDNSPIDFVIDGIEGKTVCQHMSKEGRG